MYYRISENSVSPKGNYEIVFGFQEEYRMGGPYASSIYLTQKDKPPMFIHDKCYENVVWRNDEKSCYFMILILSQNQLQTQIASFNIETNLLIVYEKGFTGTEISSIENTTLHLLSRVAPDYELNSPATFDLKTEKIQSQNSITSKIRIIPNDGIEFISIGEEKTSVEKRVKGFSDIGNTQNITYYTTYGFHVHYDDKNLVESIEIMLDMQGVFELYDKNPHTTEIQEMVEILKAKNNGETNPIDEPESYMFLELSLGIFRGSTPEKYQLFIEQYKREEPDSFKNGTPEWMLEEFEKTKHFQTVLIGNKDYFRNPIYYFKE